MSSAASIKDKLASICSPPQSPQYMPPLTAAPTLTPTPSPTGSSPVLYVLVGLVVGVVGVLIAVKAWAYLRGDSAAEAAAPPQPPVNANDFFNGIARSLIQQRQQAAPAPRVEPVTPVPTTPPATMQPVAHAPAPQHAPAAPVSAVADPLADDPNFTPI